MKMKRILSFLSEGHKVKVAVWFRGRELSHSDVGKALLEKIESNAEQISKVEKVISTERKNMSMVLASLVKTGAIKKK